MHIILINCDPDKVAIISDAILAKKLGSKIEVQKDIVRIYRQENEVLEKNQSIVLVHTAKEFVNEVFAVLENLNFEYPFSVNVIWPIENNLSFLQMLTIEPYS